MFTISNVASVILFILIDIDTYGIITVIVLHNVHIP